MIAGTGILAGVAVSSIMPRLIRDPSHHARLLITLIVNSKAITVSCHQRQFTIFSGTVLRITVL